mgnify:CR=1 FL=1
MSFIQIKTCPNNGGTSTQLTPFVFYTEKITSPEGRQHAKHDT